jgi:hypothetical protein
VSGKPAIVLALVLGWTLGPTFVEAQARPEVALTLLGGVVKPDAGLADYQWDTRPQATGGAQAMVGLGPWGAGLRWTQSSTTQELGSAASAPEASVRTRALEAVVRRQVLAFGGQSVFLDAAVGRTRLSYAPEHVTMDAGGTPVVVTLAPIEEWSWGGGAGIERGLSSSLVGGLELGYRAFGMDTAHQAGGEVVYERRTFAEWSTRFTLGWRFRT